MDGEMVECALCGRSLPFSETYAPGDDAICPPCDTEVTGRSHPDWQENKPAARIDRANPSQRQIATYGATVFWLLHWRTEREKRKGDALLRLIPGTLIGRSIRQTAWAILCPLGEARRTYLALCKRFNVTPEACEATS